MIAASLAGLFESLGVDAATALVVAPALALVAAAILTALAIALARRGRRREGEEIVRHLEEMRSGRARGRLEVDARSPFAPIAESANRLGQELAVRWSRAEVAGDAFQALQEAAHGYAVVTTDSDGDVRTVSPGAVQLFGWEEDAVLGRNASMLFDEASWRDLLPKLARKSLRERGIETRALMARRDASRFHARIQLRLVHGAHGDHPGFLLVVQDVSEQVRVEGELRAAEQRSRLILERLPGAVALVEAGRIVFANPALDSLLHAAPHATDGRMLLDHVATADVLLVRDALARVEAAVAGTSVELAVALTDARGRPIADARCVAVSHPHEGRPGALVVLEDVGAQYRLERALVANEARLEALVDAWGEAVALVEEAEDGARVRLANRAFLELFGLERREVLGGTEGDLLRRLRQAGDSGAAAAACLAAAAGGPARDVVTWEGRPARTVSVWAAPVGSRGRFLAARDISETVRRQAELEEGVAAWQERHEALEASHAKLAALHRALEVRREEAEELARELRTLDGMKSDLLANVSHELQTPLVSIRGYTEMILKGRLGPINDEQRKGLSLSLKNIDRLIAMIDNLLAFARMDRQAGSVKLQSFPLTAVVDEALALLRERLEAKGLRVTRRLESSAVKIRADRDKILQVFLNLLSNATKFNRDGGEIEIAARRGKPGFVLVQVRDTGVGIAKEEIEKIFDRFYQAESGVEGPHEGTGIGLAIVQNILRLHGCVIHAASEVGEGTTFSFTLPIEGERIEGGERSEDAERAAPPLVATPPPPPTERAQHRERPPAPPVDRPRLRIIRRS